MKRKLLGAGAFWFFLLLTGCPEASLEQKTNEAVANAPNLTNLPAKSPPGADPGSGVINNSVAVDPVTAKVFELTNQFRAQNGVALLQLNEQLSVAAKTYAEKMETLGFLNHNSPDGSTPGDRIAASGYNNVMTWGENIAMGYATPEDVMTAWINSPGHKANLLNADFKDIGIGHSKGNYWVQDFGAR